jgi:hypothetical protein
MITLKPKTPDRLSLLRQKYTAQLRAKREEISILEKKLAVINELDSESAEMQKPTEKPGAHYAGMNLTAATLDVVRELGGKVTVADVRKRLLNNGWLPKGKNFGVTVAKTLKRLQGQGKLETDLHAGKRRFWNADALRLSVLKAI